MAGRGVIRIAVLAVAAGVVLVLVAGFVWRPTSSSQASRPATKPCVQRLMQDWRDGRIDGTYPLPCYQRTISQLPADLRVYSSAADDIRQARATRIVQSAGRTARRPS
jgi:hypothetical protein